MTQFEKKRRELSLLWEQKRARADAEAEDRKARLAEQDEEYRAILEEKLSYEERILAAVRMPTPEEMQAEIARLGDAHRALRARERAYLQAHGLSEDYLLPRYECALCGDTGYLEGGRMCRCLSQAVGRLQAEESGLFSLFETQTFESFDPSLCGPATRQAYEYCREYAESFDAGSSPNLLFVGGTGLGKTHLSSAIGRAALERGFCVVYEGAMQALSALEGERFLQEKPETARLLSCDLLILDDLGTELPGKSTVSFLYQLVNTRLIRRVPTILSTNLSARELEARYEARLFSRLTGEYEVLLFDGEDARGREEA